MSARRKRYSDCLGSPTKKSCPGAGRLRPRWRGDGDHDVELQRVGVLVLVQQQGLVALRQLDPHPLAVERVAHEAPAEHEEVVERQPPGPAAALRLGQREAGQLVTEAAEDGLDHRVEGRGQGAALHRAVDQALRRGASRHRAAVGGRGPSTAAVAAGLGRLGVEQHVEDLDLVDAGLGQLHHLLQPARQPSLEVDGQLVRHAEPDAGREQLPPRLHERLEVERRRFGPRRVGPPHAVPVVVELLGHRPQLGHGDAELQRQHDGALQLRATHELRVEGPEALVEVELGRDLVEHRQCRGQPGLDRVGRQDALCEGVQGAQRGLVEVVERGAAALLHHTVAVVGGPLEQGQPDPLAQLVGRLLREGDGGDGLDGRASAHERDHAADQLGGLAGARTGRHEQGGPEVAGDAVARVLVGEAGGVAHGAAPSSPSPATSAASSSRSSTSRR